MISQHQATAWTTGALAVFCYEAKYVFSDESCTELNLMILSLSFVSFINSLAGLHRWLHVHICWACCVVMYLG